MIQFLKDRWAATGPRFFLAGIGGGLAVFALYLAAAIATGNAQAQDVTAPNVTATGVIRGGANTTPNNTTLAGDFKGAVGITGVLTTSGDVSIVGGRKLTATGNTELGAPGNATTLVVNGKSTTINTVSTDINSANTNTKSITATGNVTASGVVTGKLGLSAGNGGFTVSNTGATTATSVTAGNIATTGGKVNINGTNGNIVTQGVLNAGGKAIIHGDSGNIDTVGTVTTNKLTANSGARIGGGLDVTNAKITRVATGTADMDAVNVLQLNNTVKNAKDEAITTSKEYTDTRITSQSGADREYTSQQVGAETQRAMAAEAALSKETKQVGAMAMAAAAVAGATPVGDKKTAVSAAVGGYSGQTAVAVGVSHMVKPNVKLFGSFSSVTGGKTGTAIGASFSF